MSIRRAFRLWPALILIAPLGLQMSATEAANLRIACGSTDLEITLCREAVKKWEEETGHTVEFRPVINDTTERLKYYLRILEQKSDDIDIFQVDVIATGILAKHFVNLSEYDIAEHLQGQFDNVLKASYASNILVALPWFIDIGVLYYRKDLLQKYNRSVPDTWMDLVDTARIVSESESREGSPMSGYVFQGKKYEGLTCNALEWILSFGGNGIIGENGQVLVNDANAAKALKVAKEFLMSVAPRSVLQFDEEDTRGEFQEGRAVFMRHWPGAWALLNGENSPVKGKVSMALLPKGGNNGRHVGVLGGWQLAVSRYSMNVEVAVDLAKSLTEIEEQKLRATRGNFLPTYIELYSDSEIAAANPLIPDLIQIVENAVARPSGLLGEQYNEVSSVFYSAIQEILAEEDVDVNAKLAELELTLRAVVERDEQVTKQ